MSTRFGILDIGSNTFHFVIVEVNSQKQIRTLFRFRNVLRLGDFHTGSGYLISESHISESIEIIRKCQEIAKEFSTEVIAFATSAVRESLNSEEFRKAIKKQTGVKIRILEGDEEASLIYRAISRQFRDFPNPLIAIDIGGGSTEVIIGEGSKILELHSFRLGTVRMKEMFLDDSQSFVDAIPLMQDYIEHTLSNAPRTGIKSKNMYIATGSSGIIRTIMGVSARINKPLFFSEMQKVTLTDLKSIFEQALTCANINELTTKFDLKQTKADVLISGLLILRDILFYLKIDEIVVSDCGVREGVGLELIGE